MAQDIVQSEQIAQALMQRIGKARLIGVVGNQGPVPSLTLLFENAEDARAEVTFQPALAVKVIAGSITADVLINVSIGDFRK